MRFQNPCWTGRARAVKIEGLRKTMIGETISTNTTGNPNHKKSGSISTKELDLKRKKNNSIPLFHFHKYILIIFTGSWVKTGNGCGKPSIGVRL